MATRESTTTRAPELAYLLALKSQLETQYQYQDLQIDRSREVRELRVPVPVDKDLLLVPGLQIHDPTATATGLQTADMLSLRFPKVSVTPEDPDSDPAQERATDLEHWLTEVLRTTGRNPRGPISLPTFAALVDGAVNDGGGWSKFVWQPHLWAARNRLRLTQFVDQPTGDAAAAAGAPQDEEAAASAARNRFERAKEQAKRQAGPPFAWRGVDVRTLYPVYYGDDLGEVLEVTRRPASQLYRQYRLTRSEAGDLLLPEEVQQGRPDFRSRTRDWEETTAGQELLFLEHWDADWLTYACVGRRLDDSPTAKVVKQFRHHYGRLPYFAAPGLMLNHWRNRKVGWGITEPMRFLVELRSFLWTLMGNLAARDTFPLLQEVLTPQGSPAAAAYVTQGDDQRGEQLRVVRWGLREILRARTGYRYEPIAMPQVAEALKILMAAIDQAITGLKAPQKSDLSGLEGAGFAINQVLAYEAVKIGRVKTALEDCLTELCYFVGHLLQTVVEERVWVYATGPAVGWLGIGPEDWRSAAKIGVELDPEQPSAKLIEQRMLHEAVDKGTLSLDQAVTELGRSPSEVRRGRAMDRLRATPLYEHLFEQSLLAELGRGDLVALTMQAQQLAQQGNPALGIPPPAGPGPGSGQIPAMGNEVVPDMGALAMSPNGRGAALTPPPGAAPGGPVPQQGLGVGTPSMAGPPAGSQRGVVGGQQPLLP